MGSKKNRKHLRKNRKHLRIAGVDTELAGLDRVVSERQAAAILGCSKDTLRRGFRAGRAPPRVRLSQGRIGYRLSALYGWLEAHTEKPSAMP